MPVKQPPISKSKAVTKLKEKNKRRLLAVQAAEHERRKQRALRVKVDKKLKIQEKLCELIANGMSLPQAVAAHGKYPSYQGALYWMHNDPDFAEMVRAAQVDRADYLFEETLEIADDGRNDWMQRNDPNNPGWIQNNEAMQRSRLRVDTRKWAVARLNPGKYSEKVAIEGSPDKPIVVAVMHKVVNVVHQETLPEPERVSVWDEDQDA